MSPDIARVFNNESIELPFLKGVNNVVALLNRGAISAVWIQDLTPNDGGFKTLTVGVLLLKGAQLLTSCQPKPVSDLEGRDFCLDSVRDSGFVGAACYGFREPNLG